jgi:hypothetical protein
MFSRWTVDQALAMDDGPSLIYHYGSFKPRDQLIEIREPKVFKSSLERGGPWQWWSVCISFYHFQLILIHFSLNNFKELISSILHLIKM